MPRKGLSRELALRIGLAAQALGIGVQELVKALVSAHDLPLTAKKLASVGAADLGRLLLGRFDAAELEEAAGLLHGESEISTLPELEPYEEGDMPLSIRVAVASNGDEMLDGHFASCESFLIYQVSADEIRLIDSCPTESAVDGGDRTAGIVKLIADCHVVFVVSVGGPAAAKVVKAGIHPIKRAEGGRAREVLAELQPVLAGSPPPWLAKVLGVSPEERVRFTMEEEA
jgi:nitrogen fixation protein NifX